MTSRPTEGLVRERLDNGVTLLVQRRRSAPAAALITRIGAGFLDEPDDLVGVSHVLEHMLFKGTPSLGPGELARRTKALGGSLNAHTAYDRTVYHAVVPARHARELARLQADQVQHPLIDAEELRRELGVIIQEARRKLDTPSALTGELLHELLFDTHRIRRWRIGVPERLETLTRDEVAGYYLSRYVPARTIVALVGDIDPPEALDLLRESWAGWQRPAVPIPPWPQEHSRPVRRARRLEGDVASADLSLGWRGVGTLDPRVPAFDVMGALLGMGRGARFPRLLREPGIVSSVGAGHYSAADAGVFAIGAELEGARLGETLTVIGAAITHLRDHGPDPDEMDRVRALLRVRLQRRLERYEGRAIALAEAEAEGDVTRLDREEEELLAVSPAMVRDLIAEHLGADAASAVVQLPTGDPAPLDAQFLGEALRSASRPLPPIARSSRGPAGTVRRATGTRAHGVLHVPLPGLDVLAARHRESSQVTIGVYRARHEREDPATAGLAALGLRSMLRGTVRRDAAELALAIESMGGVFTPTLGVDSLGFGTAVVMDRAHDAAALLAELLLEPRFDPAGVRTERDLLAQDARAVADDMARFPFELAFGVAFDDRGYGAPTLGTAASLETFDAAAVRAWHGRFLAGGATTVVVVGDAEPEWLAEAAVTAFVERLPAVGESAPAPALDVIHAGVRVEQRARQQSALAMLFPGPKRSDPDRFAAATWSAIASGLGGRLFEALRDRRSLAYTVQAGTWQRRTAGALLTYIAMAPERLAEAREAMLAELATFAATPPDAEELSRATAMLTGVAEMSRQTGGSYAGEIADAWLHGAGLSELDDPAAPYREVTAADVHRVAAESLDPARRAEGVVESAPTR